MSDHTLSELLSQKSPGNLVLGGARMALVDIEDGFWGIRRQIEALIGNKLANSVLQQAGANGGASFARSFAPADKRSSGADFEACLNAYQAAGFGKFQIEDISWPIGKIVIRAEDTFEAWMMKQHQRSLSEPCCAYTAGVLVGFINVLSQRTDVVCIEHDCQGKGDPYCTFELLPDDEAQGHSVVSYSPDPGLGRKLNLLEMLFERMPMGIAVLDREFRMLRYNETWEDFSSRYAPEAGKELAPGVGYFEHIPGAETVILPLFERVLAGETVQQDEVRLEAGNFVSFWDVVLSPLMEEDQIIGILIVSLDVTNRVRTQQALAENQRTLATLISNLPGMAYRCKNDPDWSMEFVSEGSLELTGYSPEKLIDNNQISYGELIHPEDRQKVRDKIDTALDQQRSFQISYRINTPEGMKWVWEQGQGVLDRNGRITALEGFITDITERVQAQQHLEQRVEERTRELQTLLQVSRDLNASLDLSHLLDSILDELKTVVDYSGASILTVAEDELKVRAYRGPIPKQDADQLRFSIDQALHNKQVIENKQPLIISDIWENSKLAKSFRQTADIELDSTFGYVSSWMAVPLLVKGKVLGMLTLDHSEPNYYSDHHARLVLAFANHAAVALENARLYLETERRAEESETLFSVQQAITSNLEMDQVLQLIADEARRLTETDISAVYLLEGEVLRISYVSGDVPDGIVGYQLDLDGSVAGQVVKSGKAVLIQDTWQDPEVDRTAADQAQARSLLIVPLLSGSKTIGTITVANRTPGGFKIEDEQLLTKLAANVVISLDNARLYQAESDRREVAEGMGDILGVLNSSQSLPETLTYITERAGKVMASEACLICQIDFEAGVFSVEASHGLSPELKSAAGFKLSPSARMVNFFQDERPIWISDLDEIPDTFLTNFFAEEKGGYQWWMSILDLYQALVAVPIKIGEEFYGSLLFCYRDPKFEDRDRLQLAVAFADQAALAIENARLYEAAEIIAVAEERNRLARDLHDAVTQTLFSASMIADVLPKIWKRDPEAGQLRLEELRQLTRGALSEMRTLLVELRPAALADTDLGDLIGHQINAFIARTRLEVEYQCNCDSHPPLEVKEAFYRITQEGLNNIAKHAQAGSVSITLVTSPDFARLVVKDDGVGFDQEGTSVEGLGLGIMAERALNIGAEFELSSQIHQGTRLSLTWEGGISEEEEND